jgi:hypothetical protein
MSVAALARTQQTRTLAASLDERKGGTLSDIDPASLPTEWPRGFTGEQAERAKTAECDLAETVCTAHQNRVDSAGVDPTLRAGEGFPAGCARVRDDGGWTLETRQSTQRPNESIE